MGVGSSFVWLLRKCSVYLVQKGIGFKGFCFFFAKMNISAHVLGLVVRKCE